MTAELPPFIEVSTPIAAAINSNQPIVALESTVITHGLPYPENLKLAREMENIVRLEGAHPATIGLLDGRIYVGTNLEQLERLASGRGLFKVSTRDLAPAVVNSASGGTTVAATMLVTHLAGIRVFATGGIGGVHRGECVGQRNPYDVSADLQVLSQIPVIVVCAGAKAILDLPATLEMLETFGVPVVGYQTDEFPAFYSRASGLKTSAKADNPEKITQLARAHWSMGLNSGVLVVVPPPEDVALPFESVEKAIQQALKEAKAHKIHGQAVTPYLLGRVNELTEGLSKKANLGLLVNNAKLAAQIARAWAGSM